MPRKIPPGFGLTPEQIQDVDAAAAELARSKGASSRTAMLFAFGTLTAWLLLLASIHFVAQWLYQPSGAESWRHHAAYALNPLTVLPLAALCSAAAFQVRRRGLFAGSIVYVSGSAPALYFIYEGTFASERALAEGRSTASALSGFFTTMAMYPAIALGVLVGFLVGRLLTRRRAVR